MVLNGLICADVPLSNYSLTLHLLAQLFFEIQRTASKFCAAPPSPYMPPALEILAPVSKAIPCYARPPNER